MSTKTNLHPTPQLVTDEFTKKLEQKELHMQQLLEKERLLLLEQQEANLLLEKQEANLEMRQTGFSLELESARREVTTCKEQTMLKERRVHWMKFRSSSS